MFSSLTYPDGTVIDYNYGTSGEWNDRVSRLSSLLDGSTHLEDYLYLGLAVVVQRSHPEPGVDMTYMAASGTGYSYDGLNQLASFDRGTLSSTKTRITGTPARTQGWTPDAAGNFNFPQYRDASQKQTASASTKRRETALRNNYVRLAARPSTRPNPKPMAMAVSG